MTPLRTALSIVLAVASLIGIVLGTLGLAVLFSVDIPGILELPKAHRRGFVLWTFLVLLASWILFFLERRAMVGELRARLERQRGSQEALDGLSKLRSEGVTELFAGTPTPAEFGDWKKSFEDWEERVIAYMKPRFTAAIVGLFSELGAVPAISFTHASTHPAIKDQHLKILRMLAKELAILERVIQQGSALLKEPNPTVWEILFQRQQGG